MTIVLKKPKKVIGKNIVFRNADANDARFILDLRTNPSRNKYISHTKNDLSLQIEWLQNYANDNNQIYFIIENKAGEKFGTIRIYDNCEYSFCWGSWILKEERPSGFALESALMIYSFALDLGFQSSHFEVKKGNESVWKFHERFGAAKVNQNEDDYFYEINHDEIKKSLEKYKKYLPDGITILWQEI